MLKINPTFKCYKSEDYSYILIGQQLKIIARSTIDVFYPNQCEICSIDLNMSEKHLCLTCSYDLPYLSSSILGQNTLEKLFWGRADVTNTYSLFNYQKGNQAQDLLHLIKYKRKTKLAEYLGSRLGQKINNDQIDFIIPIPLHPKKLRKRGFNQSLVIANGIKAALNVPINNKVVKRIKHNPTQTSVSKFDRWENVRSIFAIPNPTKLINKHVLIVDDVLTTGATIEACVKQLMKIEGCKVSVATLAARV
jgi:ComF family protein